MSPQKNGDARCEAGSGGSRLKPSSYYDRVVDVCEELVKFTWMTRDASSYLTDRYSERKEEAAKLEARVNLKAAT